MTDNKNLTIPTTIELLGEKAKLEGEAYAGISLNPHFQWAKIVVTDDVKNANKQKIPSEEFDNVIKTGKISPIKLALEGISDGHDEAFGHPVGVIANLIKEANKIIALAAFWKKERPDDIQMLKEMYVQGEPPNVSWEVSYSNSDFDDDGVENLRGVSLNGLAIVAKPAYVGRTRFVAMSSKNSKEVNSMDEELKNLKEKYEKLEKEYDELKDSLSQKDKELAEKDTELAALKDYKDKVEEAKAQIEKLGSIKSKFVEAGLEKEDAFYDDNKAMLLGLSEDALDFMIQEMVAFSEKSGEASHKEKSPKVPPLTSGRDDDEVDLSPRALAKALKEMKSK